METRYKVYKHTCPNGKVYVGITSQANINRRWQNGVGYRNNVLFYRAIQKYGWDKIKHEILFEGLAKKSAEKIEIQLIKEYRSNIPEYGYNIENGGNCTGTHSEETKRKISESQMGEKNHAYGKPSPLRGRKHTQEHILKNRLSHIGQESFWKGKKMPLEAVDKMRKPKTELHKKHLSEARSIPVICVETGEWFPSGKAAADAKGFSRGSMSHVLRGNRNTAGGYHWKYATQGERHGII